MACKFSLVTGHWHVCQKVSFRPCMYSFILFGSLNVKTVHPLGGWLWESWRWCVWSQWQQGWVEPSFVTVRHLTFHQLTSAVSMATLQLVMPLGCISWQYYSVSIAEKVGPMLKHCFVCMCPLFLVILSWFVYLWPVCVHVAEENSPLIRIYLING